MSSARDDRGALHLLPAWLGEHGGIEQLTPEAVAAAAGLSLFFCEDERSGRRLLRRMVPGIDLARIEVHRFDKDSDAADAARLLQLVRDGRDAGILSEAGMPCIADPGALLVTQAHAMGISVVPHIGPSALLLTLAASGLNGQRFAFHGYPPIKPREREQALRRIEQEARRSGAAQLFIETPYRNDALLEAILRTCAPELMLAIGIDLTQPGGWVRTASIAQWRTQVPELGKRPAVFIIGTALR